MNKIKMIKRNRQLSIIFYTRKLSFFFLSIETFDVLRYYTKWSLAGRDMADENKSRNFVWVIYLQE